MSPNSKSSSSRARKAVTTAASARREVIPDAPPFLKAILKLAKPRDWPVDFALNHGHYLKGHLKK